MKLTVRAYMLFTALYFAFACWYALKAWEYHCFVQNYIHSSPSTR